MLVTDFASVSEAALFARLDRAERMAQSARARLAVQLRGPSLCARELLRLGRRLRARTAALGATLVVNDRLDIAVAVGADGVHLGRRSVAIAEARALLDAFGREERWWISVACHSTRDVVRAASEGADAALLSPIFASPGKGAAIGVSAIGEARAALADRGQSTELFALGGVDADNAAACFAAGADGVAAVRADLVPLLDRA